jgi:flagellar biosynthesis protein FliR
MQFTFAEIGGWLAAFLWPWLRVSAMLIAAPVFGNVQIPPRIVILLGLALTVALMPAVGPVPEVDLLSLPALLIAVQQVLIGIAIGLLLAFAFAAAVIAGESISLSMGLGFATMVDPQGGASVPVVSQFLQIVVTLLFLAVGGHLMLIELLAESFRTLPVGMAGIGAGGFWALANWGTLMFAGAVLIALPGIAVLLITNLALGVMTRAAPQMNIFSVGFPVTMLLGFLVLLMLVLPALPLRMSALWSEAFATARAILGS